MRTLPRLLSVTVLAAAALNLGAVPSATADGPSRYSKDYYGHGGSHSPRDSHRSTKSPYYGGKQFHTYSHRPIYNGYVYGRGWRPKVVIVRPRSYQRYHYRYFSPFSVFAFSLLALPSYHYLSLSQQRAYEAAQSRAAAAQVGETITWNDGRATGNVTVTREGDSSTGRYCREFRNTIIIAGKSEQAYGVACRQEDGSWEIVSSGK